LTALTFVREAHEVKKGQWILVQAAAGGLGRLLCQLCSHLGARVIGTTSTEEKAEIARQSGAEHVILYGEGRDVVSEVYKLTGGEGIERGVHAVFDGVGKDTFEMDFELLRRYDLSPSLNRVADIVIDPIVYRTPGKVLSSLSVTLQDQSNLLHL
jgi:NADPH:quinone reductase-like Zn-dependent oxidoreductase